MTIYVCHGCGRFYNDELGMPIRCCDKIIRHKLADENWYDSEEDYNNLSEANIESQFEKLNGE